MRTSRERRFSGNFTSIMGVGATKRLSAIRWKMMGRIVVAWILTLPLTMAVGYALMWSCMRMGW